MSEFKYEIKERLVVLSNKNGYTMEFNIVSFNNGEPMYDIRKWNTNEDRMMKGISLNKEELLALRDKLNEISI